MNNVTKQNEQARGTSLAYGMREMEKFQSQLESEWVSRPLKQQQQQQQQHSSWILLQRVATGKPKYRWLGRAELTERRISYNQINGTTVFS